MAVQNPPGWLQNAGSTHTAAQLRMYMAMLEAGTYSTATTLRSRGGVHPALGQELVVTQTGSPSMAVLVEAGAVSVPGTESSTQGNYFVVNDAQVTLSVTAAHATLPRIDIVVVNIRDQFYSGSSNDCQLQVVAGTPASSPVAPSAPNNAIIIAQIAVGAAVTSIVNANITDTRFYLSSTGGVINARTEAARPASAEIVQGQLTWSMDTKKLFLWDGSAYNQLYPSYDKLNDSTIGSPQASFSFSSFSNAYSSLKILILARGDTSANAIDVTMRFNSDTSAVYETQRTESSATTVSAFETIAATSAHVGGCAAANALTGAAGMFEITIPFYNETNYWTQFESLNSMNTTTGSGTGSLITKHVGGRWRNTSAVTTITFLPSSGNFAANSKFVLYGIP